MFKQNVTLCPGVCLKRGKAAPGSNVITTLCAVIFRTSRTLHGTVSGNQGAGECGVFLDCTIAEYKSVTPLYVRRFNQKRGNLAFRELKGGMGGRIVQFELRKQATKRKLQIRAAQWAARRLLSQSSVESQGPPLIRCSALEHRGA